MSTKEKFFILGYYGWKNTGDDAMLYGLLSALKEKYPDSSYRVTSSREMILPPAVDEVEYVNPHKMIEFFKNLFKSSVFILGGGTHLFDYGTLRIRIPRLSQLFILSALVKLTGKKCYLLGMGVEKPQRWWGKILIKNTCRMADLIVVRDSMSWKVLEEMGFKDKTYLSFDLSALIPFKPVESKPGERIMGVSILPFYKIYANNEKKDQKMLEKVAEALQLWLDLNPLHKIKLFIFNGMPPHDDISINQSLQQLLNDPSRVETVPYQANPAHMLEEVSTCQAFLGMRYHSAMFAFLNHIPLVVMDYAPKNESLVRDAGLSEKALISLDQILKGDLTSRIMELAQEPEEFLPSLKLKDARKSSSKWLEVLP